MYYFSNLFTKIRCREKKTIIQVLMGILGSFVDLSSACLSIVYKYATVIIMSLTPFLIFDCWLFSSPPLLFPCCYPCGQAGKKPRCSLHWHQQEIETLQGSLSPHAGPSPHLLITTKAEPISLSPLLSSYFWASLGVCHALHRKLHYVTNTTCHTLLMGRWHHQPQQRTRFGVVDPSH